MATDNDQEKTEEPTAKREEDARKKGDIARSKELNTVVVLMVGSVMIWMTGERIMKGMWRVMEEAFTIERSTLFDPLASINSLQFAMQEALMFVAPFLAAMVVAALAAPIAMGAGHLVLKPLLLRQAK